MSHARRADNARERRRAINTSHFSLSLLRHIASHARRARSYASPHDHDAMLALRRLPFSDTPPQAACSTFRLPAMGVTTSRARLSRYYIIFGDMMLLSPFRIEIATSMELIRIARRA